ncbi:Mov34/MPN/PAD-1 family protein [Syntrophobotulus glycolicus DSM 8271]|uniref:Mov34/MPN/PAD-1 family protein n=1 Tax=Syntrophobotulus glycolicus (strain DSM 8271 / FlGlyR) TaxID=645991 RepID=F0SYS4_SYNGF|nr:M67 family metallopeptidase [Syntrophobotulus glycolicus]ADY54875.1 Mov34/MPN/PAD-1 family protein [Syntrophobotulus glycolicus DSM 8271]
MIVISQRQFNEVLNHTLQGFPNEACGLLGGKIEGDLKHIEKVYLLTNTDHSPEHFSMDPKEQFAAIKDMRTNGWVMLGNFHSHPGSPSRPSEEDKRLAFDPEMSYLILSLLDRNNPVLKSFKILKNTVEEEEIICSEEAG